MLEALRRSYRPETLPQPSADTTPAESTGVQLVEESYDPIADPALMEDVASGAALLRQEVQGRARQRRRELQHAMLDRMRRLDLNTETGQSEFDQVLAEYEQSIAPQASVGTRLPPAPLIGKQDNVIEMRTARRPGNGPGRGNGEKSSVDPTKSDDVGDALELSRQLTPINIGEEVPAPGEEYKADLPTDDEVDKILTHDLGLDAPDQVEHTPTVAPTEVHQPREITREVEFSLQRDTIPPVADPKRAQTELLNTIANDLQQRITARDRLREQIAASQALVETYSRGGFIKRLWDAPLRRDAAATLERQTQQMHIYEKEIAQFRQRHPAAVAQLLEKRLINLPAAREPFHQADAAVEGSLSRIFSHRSAHDRIPYTGLNILVHYQERQAHAKSITNNRQKLLAALVKYPALVPKTQTIIKLDRWLVSYQAAFEEKNEGRLRRLEDQLKMALEEQATKPVQSVARAA